MTTGIFRLIPSIRIPVARPSTIMDPGSSRASGMRRPPGIPLEPEPRSTAAPSGGTRNPLIGGPRFIAAVLALVCWSTAVAAQNPFAAAVMINNTAVTHYEIEQRTRLLRLLRTPGDPRVEAKKILVDERLYLIAASRDGVIVSDSQIDDGILEFGQRLNLSRGQLMEILADAGVEEETFRAFTRASLAWRVVVQTRFGPRARVTEEEVDRAVALANDRSGARVLLSEIILPARNPEEQNRATAFAVRLSGNIDEFGGFAAAARRFSISPTSFGGGRLEWLPLSFLPSSVQGVVLALGEGEVSDPVPLNDSVGIFQLHVLDESRVKPPATAMVDFIQLQFPENPDHPPRAAVAELKALLDDCGDIHEWLLDNPNPSFERVTASPSELRAETARAVAVLNEGGTTALRRDGGLTFLMLCSRVSAIADEVEDSRSRLRSQLFSRRLEAYADNHLEELRADAIIIEK